MSEGPDDPVKTTVSGKSFECPGCDYSTIVFGGDSHADICPECGTDALVPADDAETIRENRKEAAWIPPVGKHADVEDLYPIATLDNNVHDWLHMDLRTVSEAFGGGPSVKSDLNDGLSLKDLQEQLKRVEGSLGHTFRGP